MTCAIFAGAASSGWLVAAQMSSQPTDNPRVLSSSASGMGMHAPAVRLTFSPLTAPAGESQIPVHDATGQVVTTLWSWVGDWPNTTAALPIQVLGAESITLPAVEASEPATGAIARIAQALQGHGGLLVLRQPATSFPVDRILFAAGARLFAIESEADEQCWDAMLSHAQPIYGLRDTIACPVRSAHPAAVISALAYGTFTCEHGLAVAKLDENRTGVSWQVDDEVETSVIIRDGFEAARVHGREGTWQDRGNELYVRLVMRSAQGTAWTQPRFVAPGAHRG